MALFAFMDVEWKTPAAVISFLVCGVLSLILIFKGAPAMMASEAEKVCTKMKAEQLFRFSFPGKDRLEPVSYTHLACNDPGNLPAYAG